MTEKLNKQQKRDISIMQEGSNVLTIVKKKML